SWTRKRTSFSTSRTRSCPSELLGRVTMRMRRTLVTLSIVPVLIAIGCLAGIPGPTNPVVVEAPQAPAAPAVTLPNQSGSLKFTVLGDFGTAARPEYELAAQMAKFFTGF